MNTPYLKQDPKQRAADDKELAKLAVPYFQKKRELSSAKRTVEHLGYGPEQEQGEGEQEA